MVALLGINILVLIIFVIAVFIFRTKLLKYIREATGKYLYQLIWFPVAFVIAAGFASRVLRLVGIDFIYIYVIQYPFQLLVVFYYIYLFFCALNVYRAGRGVSYLVNWSVAAVLALLYAMPALGFYLWIFSGNFVPTL